MNRKYEEALQQVLQAVRRGESLESAIERFPEYASALRTDVTAAESVRTLSTAVPASRPEARSDASRRLSAQLAKEREAPPRGFRFRAPGLLRYAAAAAVLAVVVFGAGLVLQGGGSGVEASTIEGVVVDNQGGVLTVQTLDALEQVEVPEAVPISDIGGATLNLGGIQSGEVVVVNLERRGREVVAQRIQRFVGSLEAWCDGESDRCRALAAGLERAKEGCARSPAGCRFALERLEQLRLRAGETVNLEELKAGCRGGLHAACREIVRHCRDAADACRPEAAELPANDRPSVARRLEALESACLAGDEGACRQLARACNLFSDQCPVEPPGPGDVPPTPSFRPNVSP